MSLTVPTMGQLDNETLKLRNIFFPKCKVVRSCLVGDRFHEWTVDFIEAITPKIVNALHKEHFVIHWMVYDTDQSMHAYIRKADCFILYPEGPVYD